jgi:hypothetical protein
LKQLIGFFCRSKHWQVFLLVWGAYFVAGVGIVNNPQRTPRYSEVAFFLFVLFFAGWLWSIGTFSSSIAEPALRRNNRFFSFAIIFAGLYLPIILGFPLKPKSSVAVLMLFLFLFAIYCWAYAYYFVAKSLVTAEKRRAVTRKDYQLTMLMLCFAFIGVWEIQPRVNRLYQANHA